jgi:hypothetical protein
VEERCFCLTRPAQLILKQEQIVSF